MRLWFVLIVVIVLACNVWGDESVPRTRVGDRFIVKTFVGPSVLEIDEDGEPVLSEMPDPPYVYNIKYNRDVMKFLYVNGASISTVSEDNDIRVESNGPESSLYFVALKVTEPIGLGLYSATAAGEDLEILEGGTITIGPRSATFTVKIELVEVE